MNDTDRIKKTFAKNLRFYMDDYGLNQSDISKIADVSKQSVSYWLNEKLLPRMGTIEKLADHFHILKSDLLEEKNIVPLKQKKSLSLDFDSVIGTKIHYEVQDLIKDGVYEQYCNDPSEFEDWINNTKKEADNHISHLEKLISFMSNLKIPMTYPYTTEIEDADNLINVLQELNYHLDDLLFHLESLYEKDGNSACFEKYDTPDKKRKYLEATQDYYDFSDESDEVINTLYKIFREKEKKKNKAFKESIIKKD